MSISRTISIFIFGVSVLMMSMPANAGGFKFTPEICKKMGLGKNWYCGETGTDQALLGGAAGAALGARAPALCCPGGILSVERQAL